MEAVDGVRGLGLNLWAQGPGVRISAPPPEEAFGHLVVSIKRGPQYRSQIITLITYNRGPQKGTPNFRNPDFLEAEP